MDARFVEAPNSPAFTFHRERPARNWAKIAIGASASFANGMQPFVQSVTVQGNDKYVRYGGTAGLRYSFEQATDDGAVDIFRGDRISAGLRKAGSQVISNARGGGPGAVAELEIAVQAQRARACAGQAGSPGRDRRG